MVCGDKNIARSSLPFCESTKKYMQTSHLKKNANFVIIFNKRNPLAINLYMWWDFIFHHCIVCFLFAFIQFWNWYWLSVLLINKKTTNSRQHAFFFIEEYKNILLPICGTHIICIFLYFNYVEVKANKYIIQLMWWWWLGGLYIYSPTSDVCIYALFMHFSF